MKKLTAMLLSMLMVLSLAACGSAGGETTTESRDPLAVELTMDNWTEYFEIVMEEAVFQDLTGSQIPDRIYSVALKDGVVFSQKQMETVTFLFRYNMGQTYFTVEESGNIVWGATEASQAQEGRREIFVGDPFPCELVNSAGSGVSGDLRYVKIPADVEITGVSGTLYFD